MTYLCKSPALFNFVHGPNLVQVFSKTVSDNVDKGGHSCSTRVDWVRRERDLLKRLSWPLENILCCVAKRKARLDLNLLLEQHCLIDGRACFWWTRFEATMVVAKQEATTYFGRHTYHWIEHSK